MKQSQGNTLRLLLLTKSLAQKSQNKKISGFIVACLKKSRTVGCYNLGTKFREVSNKIVLKYKIMHHIVVL